MTTNAKNLVSGRQIEEAWKVLDDALNGKVDGIEYAYGDSFPMEKLIEAVAPMLAQAGDAVSVPVAWQIRNESNPHPQLKTKQWSHWREISQHQYDTCLEMITGGNLCGYQVRGLYAYPPHDDGKVTRDAELWAIHMMGPDDVVAAPSKQAADRVAANFNAFYEAHKHERTHDVRVVAEVIEWTRGPVEHAKDVLASFAEYADLLEPFEAIKEHRG